MARQLHIAGRRRPRYIGISAARLDQRAAEPQVLADPSEGSLDRPIEAHTQTTMYAPPLAAPLRSGMILFSRRDIQSQWSSVARASRPLWRERDAPAVGKSPSAPEKESDQGPGPGARARGHDARATAGETPALPPRVPELTPPFLYGYAEQWLPCAHLMLYGPLRVASASPRTGLASTLMVSMVEDAAA